MCLEAFIGRHLILIVLAADETAANRYVEQCKVVILGKCVVLEIISLWVNCFSLPVSCRLRSIFITTISCGVTNIAILMYLNVIDIPDNSIIRNLNGISMVAVRVVKRHLSAVRLVLPRSEEVISLCRSVDGIWIMAGILGSGCEGRIRIVVAGLHDVNLSVLIARGRHRPDCAPEAGRPAAHRCTAVNAERSLIVQLAFARDSSGLVGPAIIDGLELKLSVCDS